MTDRVASPVWHPFTQHAVAPEALAIASAQGAWLTMRNGSQIFDGISSWWVVTHGHCHPRIMGAIRCQTELLDQVIFAGCTHEPAERLAEKLIAIAPPGLSHAFYSDSGSTAVEVAVKMALGYWRNAGSPRRHIVSLEHGYHGDTIGTMSVGARGVFNAAYEPLLFDVTRLPFPLPGREHVTIEALHAVAAREEVAALVIEPLILAAGGMHIYSAEVLRDLKSGCEQHGILFIADEVMTGWGRTGTRFACDHADIAPDIMCLAKGLTGGSLPLAVTLCKPEIFEAHYSADRSKTLFHSSSYTANPICCAAALANLEVWEEEPVAARIEALSKLQQERIEGLCDHPRFANVRQLGTITAVDFKSKDPGYLSDIGPRLYAFFIERGLLLRPLGNTVYVMPPYCTTARDLDFVYETIKEAARFVT